MALTVSEQGGEYKSIEPGTYPARCVRIIDLGTQHGEYEGKATVKQQVMVGWELPTELIEGGDYDGQPRLVSRFYTASLNKKSSLRKDLDSWRGKAFTEEELQGFDLVNIIGKPCMLALVANDTGKTKVSAVMALPKGMKVDPQISQSIVFDVSNWNDETFGSLSEGIQKMIKESDEYRQGAAMAVSEEVPEFNPDDDIPF